jgi:hypothetical protein
MCFTNLSIASGHIAPVIENGFARGPRIIGEEHSHASRFGDDVGQSWVMPIRDASYAGSHGASGIRLRRNPQNRFAEVMRRAAARIPLFSGSCAGRQKTLFEMDCTEVAEGRYSDPKRSVILEESRDLFSERPR